MNKTAPIGVFDSGIGGLSVLKQLMRFMPSEQFIYLGDIARVPYGNRSEDIVKLYSKQCTEFLLSKNVKLIVAACNTVSSVALETVKEVAGEVPVIGMIQPAAAAAVRATNTGKIGIIGTRATISSKAYTNAIAFLDNSNDIRIISKACPLFVPLVEEGWLHHSITRQVAEEYLLEMKKEGIDTLVLGCTHYPLLSQLLMEIIPGVALIDTGEHAAVIALRQLAELDLLREESKNYKLKPDIEFYVTDIPSVFNDITKLFLGFNVDKAVKISVDN